MNVNLYVILILGLLLVTSYCMAPKKNTEILNTLFLVWSFKFSSTSAFIKVEKWFAYMRCSVWFSIRFRSDSDQCWNIPGWQTCYSVITSNIFFQNNYMQSLMKSKETNVCGVKIKILQLKKNCFLLCLEIYSRYRFSRHHQKWLKS